MPTYVFKDKKSGEVFEAAMKIAELDSFKEENPHLEQVPQVAAMGYHITTRKPDDGFRDVMKEIKKEQPKADFNIL